MNRSPTDMGLVADDLAPSLRAQLFGGKLVSPELDVLRKHADTLADAAADVLASPHSHTARAALQTALADYNAENLR